MNFRVCRPAHIIVCFLTILFLFVLHLLLSYGTDETTPILLTSLNASAFKDRNEIWKNVQPTFTCPSKFLQGVGGKWTCGLEYLSSLAVDRKQSCVIYSLGVGHDSSFEADALVVTPCRMVAYYDPTVLQLAGPIRPSNPRVTFRKLGIHGNVGGSDAKPLKTLMKLHSDKWIDILKMDVKSDTFLSLENIMKSFEDTPFGQVLIEFHQSGVDVDRTWEVKAEVWVLSLIARLAKKGFEVFITEVNPMDDTPFRFSLINTKSLDLFLPAKI